MRRLFIILLTFVFLGCSKDGNTDITNPGNNSSEQSDDTGNNDSSGGENGGNNSGSNDPEHPDYYIKLNEADWETISVSDDITYKYHQFSDLFGTRESISVLDIDLSTNNVKVDIPYVEEGSFIKTSEAAVSVGASAAINGSYFNTTKGGSHAFFRYEGDLVTEGTEDARKNSGFSIDEDGSVSIIKKPTSGWESTSDYTLLISGPLLMFDGNIINQTSSDFNNTRHPRTALGITSDNHVIAVVVDGRFTQSSGMSTTELAQTMEALGCEYAMNFDGGGSSTAWIENRGVMNYPSDNSKWDHEGERGVATVIAFIQEDN